MTISTIPAIETHTAIATAAPVDSPPSSLLEVEITSTFTGSNW